MDTNRNMKRRQALKTLAGVTGGLMLPQGLLAATAPASDRLGPLLPQRVLGATGRSVTMLGIGGWHVGARMERAEAQAVIETAIEGGVRFFDTAESYADGESEKRYGAFLTPKYRDDIFLMTKSAAGDGATARQHLEGSLRRLRTDYVDLWQVHSVRDPADVDDRIENGVVEEMVRQKAAGRVRHIGFTGHRSPAANARVLERTQVFETCLMPINVLDPSYESFIDATLAELVARDMGVLAMKTLANGRFFGVGLEGDGPRVVPGRISLRQALYFAWSLPVSVLVYGPDDRRQLRETLALARSFQTLDADARQALVATAADLAGNEVEYYKA